MDKRKAIAQKTGKTEKTGKAEKGVRVLIIVIMGIFIGIKIASFEYEERMQERQEYAKNSYELGKAEWVILNKLPPEEAAKVQQKIQETMNSEISLKEQKKVLEEVFQIIEEYTAGEQKLIIIPSL